MQVFRRRDSTKAAARLMGGRRLVRRSTLTIALALIALGCGGGQDNRPILTDFGDDQGLVWHTQDEVRATANREVTDDPLLCSDRLNDEVVDQLVESLGQLGYVQVAEIGEPGASEIPNTLDRESIVLQDRIYGEVCEDLGF